MMVSFYEIIVTDYISDYLNLTSQELSLLSRDVLNKEFLNNCPNGTIIGIPIDGSTNNQKKVYYPMLSHINMPISAGERAWAFNQNPPLVSYWLTRKVQNMSAEDLNFTHDDRARIYPHISNSQSSIQENSSKFFDAFKSVLPLTSVRSSSISRSKEFVGEPVAHVKSKSNDLTLQGSNGTLINLTNLNKPKTATIDIVTGLSETLKKPSIKNSENYEEVIKPAGTITPSVDDASRIIISQNFNADEYYELPDSKDSSVVPTISLKTDAVRIIPKKDLKIIVGIDDSQSKIIIKNDGNIIIQQGSNQDCKIKLTGEIANQPYVLHDELVSALNEIKNSILNLKTSIELVSSVVDPLATAATGVPLPATNLITTPNSSINASIANIENAISRIGSTRIVGS